MHALVCKATTQLVISSRGAPDIEDNEADNPLNALAYLGAVSSCRFGVGVGSEECFPEVSY